ncbi:MAG: hypothetical protein IJW92_07005 [Clostridia bacterium]|nr:hypothetical protein [Clostridia bacterium]
MSSSAFYEIAINLINAETKRLDSFCSALDKNTDEKKKQIVEYKRAKYRYAGATKVWCMFLHCHRLKDRNKNSHYLIPQVDEIFLCNPTNVAIYNNALDAEKCDYGLYFGVTAFADAEIAKLEEKLPHAADWEKIELEERIGGLRFAKACLGEAWQKRKEANK